MDSRRLFRFVEQGGWLHVRWWARYHNYIDFAAAPMEARF